MELVKGIGKTEQSDMPIAEAPLDRSLRELQEEFTALMTCKENLTIVNVRFNGLRPEADGVGKEDEVREMMKDPSDATKRRIVKRRALLDLIGWMKKYDSQIELDYSFGKKGIEQSVSFIVNDSWIEFPQSVICIHDVRKMIDKL